MKDCVKTCSLFYLLFLTYLFMYGLTAFNSSDLKKLDNLLDEKQRVIYDKIKKERLHHFYMGLGMGALLGLFVILSGIKIRSKYCLSGIILLFTTCTVYYVLPKSDYMLKHLETKEKRLAWMNVNRNFVKKKIAGFGLAFVLYFCLPMLF